MPELHSWDEYEPVDSVPDGIKWRPVGGRKSATHVKFVSTPGGYYRTERCLETGELKCYRLKDTGPAMTSKEKLDTEPTRGGQVRYKVGATCWFVKDQRWFLVEIAERREVEGTRGIIVLKPMSELDADKQVPWPFGGLFEIPADERNKLYKHLRPLRDRYT